MKAIYINLDPYLAAFAAWLKGGKPGPAPHFDPLPLAVNIPIGQSVGIIVPGVSDPPYSVYSVDSKLVTVSLDKNMATFPDPPAGESVVDANFGAGYSNYATSDTVNTVFSVSGNSTSVTVYIFDSENDVLIATIPFTVLVRRETASGPVDLVDFTPPAALTADAINTALVAAGTGALAGVYIDGAKLSMDGGIVCGLRGGGDTTVYYNSVGENSVITDIIGNVSSSN